MKRPWLGPDMELLFLLYRGTGAIFEDYQIPDRPAFSIEVTVAEDLAKDFLRSLGPV